MKNLTLFFVVVGAILVGQATYALNTSAEEVTTWNTPETSGGVQIGEYNSSTVGFHGAAPTAQRAGAAQVSVSATAAVSSGPFGYSTAAQADGIVTLLNEIRAALVQKGLIKGAP